MMTSLEVIIVPMDGQANQWYGACMQILSIVEVMILLKG
jgi:hypothetical protein